MVQAKISEPTGDYMIRNIIIDFENEQGTFSSTLYDSNVGQQENTNINSSNNFQTKTTTPVTPSLTSLN